MINICLQNPKILRNVRFKLGELRSGGILLETIRIGSGAGYAGDRIEPALDLIEYGNIDYIVFECLAERTIALAQLQKLKDPSKGYNDLLEYRMEKVLPACIKNKVKIITNMGAANPVAAAKVIKKMAKDMGIKGLKIAAIIGDDILDNIDKYLDYSLLETGEKLSSIYPKIISANAYIGAEGIVKALKNGADIVIGGRIADPSLYLGPIMYEFGWQNDHYDLIGKGILAGHLLECASQVTGGYFADPGYKDIPELWNIGFPIAEISREGEIIVTKLEGSGGMVTAATCKEQILYEIHDPSSYITPDGIADFSNVEVKEIGKDRVLVRGATGRKGNDLYKVNIGYKDCYIGEGEISYGGPGAIERAQLTGEIIKKRLEYLKVPLDELRIDYIGFNSLYQDTMGTRIAHGQNYFPEIRLRVAARTSSRADAEIIGNEVESLYLNGPAGGGGARKYVRDIVSIASIFIQRSDINIDVLYEEV